MSDDIVTRLRGQRTNGRICEQAADEIERLRRELNLAHRALDIEIFGESDIDEDGVYRD